MFKRGPWQHTHMKSQTQIGGVCPRSLKVSTKFPAPHCIVCWLLALKPSTSHIDAQLDYQLRS